MRRSVPPWSALAPDKVKDSLTNDQYKLYKLIWERFMACQMAQCSAKHRPGGYHTAKEYVL